MDEEKTAGASAGTVEKKSGRWLPALILLILAAVLAVLAYVFRDELDPEGLRVLTGRNRQTAAQSEAFTYEIGSEQVFAAAGNGFAVASSSAIQLLDGSGETVFKQVVSWSTPAVSASGAGALFCDLGGSGCVFAPLSGESRAMTPAGELLTASLNENGWVILVTEAAGYKALVSVYDAEGAARYQWWSGTGYVLKACISPDNTMLAVLCAETDGGKLHVFRIDSEAEFSSLAFPGELPFDLAFMGSDTLCAVGEDALTFLATDGTVKNRYELGSYYLIDYDLGSPSFAALYVSAYRTGGGGLIETLDREGRLLGFAETERDVTCLSAAGRQLLAMTSGGLAVYEQDMSTRWTHEELMTAKKAVLRPNGDILLLSAFSAEKIDY